MKTNEGLTASRRGFTIIELLVVMGIIGVVIGLLLPAVLAAREAARRSKCVKNLGQLILATHSFEAANGGFPPSATWGQPIISQLRTTGVFSVQCRLLQFIEHGDLYNSINFRVSGEVDDLVQQCNYTAAGRSINALLCPSDPNIGAATFAPYNFPTNSAPASLAPNTYRACKGVGGMEIEAVTGHIELHNVNDGAFTPAGDDGTFLRVQRLSEFRDGLSNTLAFSEKPVGSRTNRAYSPFRDWSYNCLDRRRSTADQYVAACSRLVTVDPRFDAGASWMIPGAIYTNFYAAAPPNSLVPDCGCLLAGGFGVYSARSYHPGGVSAAMADGSVRWFSSGTALMLWRSLGTRAGGEVVSE